MSSPAPSARFGLLALVYVAAMLVAFAVFNENENNEGTAVAIWAAATVVCGWFARSAFFALLAALALPLSIPFGVSEQYLGSDAPIVLFFGVFYGFFSGIAIMLLVAIRWLATAPREASPLVSTPLIRVGVLIAMVALLLGLAGTVTATVAGAEAPKKHRAGEVAFATIDQRGRFRGYRVRDTAPAASVFCWPRCFASAPRDGCGGAIGGCSGR